MIKILSIGTDASILDFNSDSAKRQIAYGAKFDEWNVIVCTGNVVRNARVPLAAGIHVYATRSRSRLWYGFDAIQIARTLSKPDVVSVQDPFETGLAGWIIATLFRAPLHVQVHTDFLSPEYRGSLNFIRRVIARFVLGRATRVRVVSYRIQESIEKAHLTRAPITVLPIFVDTTNLRGVHAGILAGRFSKFSKRLLVVARLEREKNISLAIESFATVSPHDACLIIVGDGSERHALELLAAKLGVASRVSFEGTTDSVPYYALADLVLVPSLFEGYGRVIVEALAAGKPVLSTDVGIAREAGAIVTDLVHFATALMEWFENGPEIGTLQHYPYRSFEEYVHAYVEDIQSVAKSS